MVTLPTLHPSHPRRPLRGDKTDQRTPTPAMSGRHESDCNRAGGLATLGLLLGFLPLLGWLNWLVVLPPAVLGLILAVPARDRGATTLNVVVLALGALRLFLGGGLL
ncbi:hypothetical protein LAJ19_00490 [Deinococcus taeanensis]|uniref:hypothetical protein n=1 Tax=Deinococcus taeanensis TaxID=2737050 RepID=UPI001CDC18DC|nr:hypothetical protein [Deinococcus taeanensis]UBV42752.1 hypothetical protein LAJ19_00490 [Deinococcus taeanensis]